VLLGADGGAAEALLEEPFRFGTIASFIKRILPKRRRLDVLQFGLVYIDLKAKAISKR